MATLAQTGLPPATLHFLGQIEEQFHLDDDQLRAILKQFLKEFEDGLSNYGKPMAMIPTFVTGVPNGTETGTFLAMDLGGTNLRVCEVRLLGNHKFELTSTKYKVSEDLKMGEAADLFDYMALSVDHFLTTSATTSMLEEEDALHLGLTFSFPVEQTAIDAGKLLTWTKGFAATNAIGNDVVQLLQDALDRKHVHVKCTALVNDTVGTLLSRAYTGGGCLLGAIFGTGTNGAYLEDFRSIKKLKKSESMKATHMAVNTEWGGFDNSRSVIPRTIFDNKLDRESINPRFQAFEKCISGMYLGEITRNLLLHLIDNDIVFSGHASTQFNTHYGFDTELMSAIEADTSKDGVATRSVLIGKMGMKNEQVSTSDIEIVKWACSMVAKRAARLSGCAVAAVVQQTGHAGNSKEPIVVGIDGSLYQFYPHFEDRLREALRALLGPKDEKRVQIGLAKDGSGVGAALGALQAMKQTQLDTHAPATTETAQDTQKAASIMKAGMGTAENKE